jgi:mannose-6-phosphate isomerase
MLHRPIVVRLKSEIRHKGQSGSPVGRTRPVASLNSPLTFEPIFQERIWGGRRLAELFGKKLSADSRIGESWEIVDREEAQSVVRNGPLRGQTLHQLWTHDREAVFGKVAEAPRFPLLIKLLDAHDKLSLQVHPPENIATQLGGEPKTEFWYVAFALAGAKLLVGLRQAVTHNQFAQAVRDGTIADIVHSVPVKTGDSIFLPAGRFHAVGAGNVLVEIQQNSDTTYRVFDWKRIDSSGKARQLHVDQALQAIDFNDVAPRLIEPLEEVLVHHRLFEVQKWNLDQSREIAPLGQFAIVCCLTGMLRCVDVDLRPGEFLLVPASLPDRQIQPRADATTLLRVTIP